MIKYKKVWLTALATVAISFNSWCNEANSNHKLSLNNGKIAFQLTPGNNNQVCLSYVLNGKTCPAVILQAEIKSATGDLTYSIKKSEDKQIGTLKVVSANKQQGSLQFKFGVHNNYLKLSNFKNITTLKLNFSSAALVLPDKISEDIVLYPEEWKTKQIKIPADNYLMMNMLDNGNAILSCIWDSANINLSQQKAGDGEYFSSLELRPTQGNKLWIGINAAKNIWYQCTAELSRKPVVIDWKQPFPATWKMTMQKAESDLKAETGQSDTWPVAVITDGKITSKGTGLMNIDLKSWASNLGGYVYPVVEKDNKFLVRFPKYRKETNTYSKSFKPLIYPFEANKKTPSNITMPYNALKTILKPEVLEKLRTVRAKKSRYPATCGITAAIEKIFYREEDKKSKDIIVDKLKKMNFFVLYIRERIEEYRAWSDKMRMQLKSYQKKNSSPPELTTSLRKDLYITEYLYAIRRNKIKTPPYCQMLTDKIIKLVDSDKDGETRENECKQLGRQIRTIGGRQDYLLGMMRSITKALRMRVTLLMMKNRFPEQQEMLKNIRSSTAKIMHSKFGMEGK